MDKYLLSKVEQSVVDYVNDVTLDHILGSEAKEIYLQYRLFCEQRNAHACGYIIFRRSLMSAYNVSCVQSRVSSDTKIYIFTRR